MLVDVATGLQTPVAPLPAPDVGAGGFSNLTSVAVSWCRRSIYVTDSPILQSGQSVPSPGSVFEVRFVDNATGGAWARSSIARGASTAPQRAPVSPAGIFAENRLDESTGRCPNPVDSKFLYFSDIVDGVPAIYELMPPAIAGGAWTPIRRAADKFGTPRGITQLGSALYVGDPATTEGAGLIKFQIDDPSPAPTSLVANEELFGGPSTVLPADFASVNPPPCLFGNSDTDTLCDSIGIPGAPRCSATNRSRCTDNCPTKPNQTQTDTDGDGAGDACDSCPTRPNADGTDTDGDGIGDACDNCKLVANADQLDRGQPGLKVPDDIGDACQCGDVQTGSDGKADGVVDQKDAARILRLANNPLDPDVRRRFCDVNNDSTCDQKDASRILQAANKKPGVVLSQTCPAALGQ